MSGINCLNYDWVTPVMFGILGCSVVILVVFQSVGSLNVTLLIYGAWSTSIIQSIPYMGPGFDVAVEELREKYSESFNISHIYVSSKNVQYCYDVGSYFDDISNVYYNGLRSDNNTLVILIYSGCDNSPMFGQLGTVSAVHYDPKKDVAFHLCGLIPSIPKEWDMMTISSGATFSNLRDRLLFPTILAVGSTQYDMYSVTIRKLCAHFNWTTIAIVYEITSEAQFFSIAANMIGGHLRQFAPGVTLHLLVFPSRNVATDQIADYDRMLFTLSQVTRIIFVAARPTVTRQLMIHAYRQNFTSSDYAWLHINMAEISTGSLVWANNDSDDNVAFLAFQSMFEIIHCYDHNEVSVASLKTEFRRRTFVTYNSTFPGSRGPNEYTLTAYALIHLLTKGINTSIGQIKILSGSALAKQFLNRTFEVPPVGSIYIDAAGERRNKICLLQFDSNLKEFQRVKYYDDHTGNDLQDELNANVKWSNDGNCAPVSEPTCGFQGNLPPCTISAQNKTIYIGVGLVLTAIVILSSVYIAYNGNRTWDRSQFDELWWTIDSFYSYIASEADISLNKTSPEKAEEQYHLNQDAGLYRKSATEIYKGDKVWTKEFRISHQTFPDRHALTVLRAIKGLIHENLQPLIGIRKDSEKRSLLFLTQFQAKGSLVDLLTDVSADVDLQAYLITDFIEAIEAVHSSALVRHGNLRPSKCLVDGRLTLKVSETGFYDVLNGQPGETVFALSCLMPNHKQYYELEHSFIAPELKDSATNITSNPVLVKKSSQRSDMYSLGQSIRYIAFDGQPKQMTAISSALNELTNWCCTNDPLQRPNIQTVKAKYRQAFKHSGNLVDKLMKRMEIYATQLEFAVIDRTEVLQQEMRLCDKLLQEILPRAIVIKLRSGAPVVPEVYASVTLSFTYITEFAAFVKAQETRPMTIVSFLSNTFTLFDSTIGSFDVYKVETIGESYILASGLPERNGNRHAMEICTVARELIDVFQTTDTFGMGIQIGINTGPIAAGIVGRRRPSFCLFGDTVNTASRLASFGENGKIHLSLSTRNSVPADCALLKKIVPRGLVTLKGKGDVETFWLV